MPQKATDFLMLPWAIRGPVAVTNDTGVTRYEMSVGQLPGFVVSTPTESEALYRFKRELLQHLEGIIARGRPVPAPPGPPVRYLTPPRRRVQARVNRLKIHTATPIAASSVTL